jgi:hypothetical protein
MMPYRTQGRIIPVQPCRRCHDAEADPTIIVDVLPDPLPLCHPCFKEWAGTMYEYFISLKEPYVHGAPPFTEKKFWKFFFSK